MLIYTDGSNHDDTLTIIAALHSNVPIEAIVITANGWGHMGPSLQIFNNLTHAFGRPEIPIIMGSLYAHKDYLENHEGGDSPTGRMFARAISEKALLEIDILHGMAPELTQYPISNPVYNEDYMEEIIEVLKKTKDITILSIGAMTDVKYTVEWLINNGRRDDIKAVWQMSAGYDKYQNKTGKMSLVDRSHHSDFNIYLDPDAAADCLRLIPDKMIWVEGTATSRPYFTPEILEPITARTPLAARLSRDMIEKIQENTLTGVPVDERSGGISVWDLATFIIMFYPETIAEEVVVPVTINTDSSVTVDKTDDHTTVCYRYNNDLATMQLDEENGYQTRIITESNWELVLEKYRELMLSPQGTEPLEGREIAQVNGKKAKGGKKNDATTMTIVGVILLVIALIALYYLWNNSRRR